MRRARLLCTIDFLVDADWPSILSNGWKIIGVDDSSPDGTFVLIENDALEEGPTLDVVLEVHQTIWTRTYILTPPSATVRVDIKMSDGKQIEAERS